MSRREVEERIEKADPEELARLAADDDPIVAKAARRRIHRLRSRGVPVPDAPVATPEREAEPDEPAPAGDSEAGEVPSIATSIDGTGARRVFLIRIPSMYEFDVSDTLGLTRSRPLQMPAENVPAFRERALGYPEVLAAEIPTAYARWLIEEAFALTRKTLHRLPSELAQVYPKLGPVTRRYERHPALDEIAPAKIEVEQALDLLERPCLAKWGPPPELGRKLASRYGSRTQKTVGGGLEVWFPPLVPTDDLRRQMDELADEYFTPDRRELYRRRLLELAYILLRADRGKEAAQVRALADLFPENGVLRRRMFRRWVRHGETDGGGFRGWLLRLLLRWGRS